MIHVSSVRIVNMPRIIRWMNAQVVKNYILRQLEFNSVGLVQ